MRGRIHQRLGQLRPARAAFQAARRYAEAGAPDPMGLAVASLGEEARSDLIEAGFIESPWPVPADDVDDATAPRLIANAVRLYADQAARGSKMASAVLGRGGAAAHGPDDDLRRVVAEPLVRRLLVAYVASNAARLHLGRARATRRRSLPRTIEAVLSQPAPAPGPDLDRLAALAYQGGRYDLAEKLSSATNRPLGLWVRAKLALRRGDRAAAVTDWTAASPRPSRPVAARWTRTRRPGCAGKLAVMRLSQGEYRDSLQLLFPVAGTYWGDVIYIAERVLTVDELKAFVDGLPPPARALKHRAGSPESSSFPSRTCEPCWRGGWSAPDGRARRSPISRSG